MPRKDLSISEKIAVLELIKKQPLNTSQRRLAEITGVPKSTIARIVQQQHELLHELTLYEQGGERRLSQKRKREGKDPDVEEALSQWYSLVSKRGSVHITGPVLKKKSEEFAKSLGHNDFKATDGWLSRWKSRFGIKFKKYNIPHKERNAEQRKSIKLTNLLKDIYNNNNSNNNNTITNNKEVDPYHHGTPPPPPPEQQRVNNKEVIKQDGLPEMQEDVEESRNERLLKQMLYQMTPQAQQQQQQNQPQPQQKMNISAALGKPVNPERSRKSSLKTALTCYSTLASQNIEVENDFLPAKKARDIQFESNVSETSTIFTKPVFQPTTECPAQKSATTSVKPLSVVLKPTRDINARPKQKRILVVPNHQQSVMSNLSSLWKAGRLCDAFIGNGTVNLKVHKMILGAVCPKVLDLFYDTPQHKLPKVTFPSSVSKDALLAFAEYMYNGVLDLDPRLLDQMKVIAKQLDMKDFEQLCSNQLKSSLVPTILPNIVEPMLEEPCSSSGLLQLMSPQSGQTISAAGNNCSSGGTDSFANLPLVEVRAETDDTLMEVVNNNLTLSVVAKDEGSICDINTSNRPWVKIENVDPDDERYGREALSSGVGYSTPNNISISTSNFRHISNTNSTQSSSSSLPLSTSTTQHTNSKQNKSLPVGHTWKQNHKEKQNLGGDLDPTDPYPIGLFTANWSNVPLVDQEIKKEYNVG